MNWTALITHELRLSLGEKSEMVIFGLLLTTFEVIGFFDAAWQ